MICNNLSIVNEGLDGYGGVLCTVHKRQKHLSGIHETFAILCVSREDREEDREKGMRGGEERMRDERGEEKRMRDETGGQQDKG